MERFSRFMAGFFFLVVFSQPVCAQTDTLSLQPKLKQFKVWYNTHVYDSLYVLLGPELKAALTAGAWQKTMESQVGPAVGDIASFYYAGTHGQGTSFVANSTTTELGISLSLSKEGLINGLHLVPKKEANPVVRPQTPVGPFVYRSEDVEYDNADGSVHFGGTFTMPAAGGSFTTILLITGSGVQDRDETILGHKPFAVLADFLTKRGYAVLRVDDRGAGKTTGNLHGVTSADFAKDVEAGLDYLKTRHEVNASKIGLLGHSEGGVIAPMVAARRKDVAFIILWGAPVVGGAVTNTEQNALVLRHAGVHEPAIAAFKQLHLKELDNLQRFKDTIGLRPSVAVIFNAWKKQQPDSILQQLGVHDDYVVGKSSADIYLGLFEQPWMRFFITHNFAEDLAKVTVKVLALNGGKDTQVDAVLNLPLIQSILQKNGNTFCTTVTLSGLNHLFQTANTGDVSEYGTISETIAPAALHTIGDWLDASVKP